MLKAELLTEATESHFERMLLDDRYGFQEKHNGHRVIVAKENGTLSFFNREGERSNKSVSHRIKQALLSHPLSGFLIDGELVGGTLFLFDAIILETEVVLNDSYEYREARLHAEFENHSSDIVVVSTARTPQEKRLLWDAVLAHHGEGIVSKNMTKGYKQGRSEQHWKLKFWKTADAVVIGPSPEGKDSVEIGMFDNNGRMKRISGCSLRGKFRVKPGQVIEVEFLYATLDRNIVQPVLLAVRFDKPAADCKLSQLDQYVNKNWVGAK